MKRSAIALVTGLLLVAGLAPGLALASTFTVDQTQTTVDDFDLSSAIDAQTFTPSMYGPLDSVDLYLGVSVSSATVSVTVQGTTGSPAVPNGTVLASKVLGVHTTAGAWTRFDFSSPAVLLPGHVYALVVLPTDNASFFGSGADLYSRGRALTFSGGSWVTELSATMTGPSDWAFKTNMGLAAATPTPTPVPTRAPTAAPAATAAATAAPTGTPTAAPTATDTPTAAPTATDTSAVAGSTAAATPPAASGSGSGSGSSGSSDMTIPIIGALIAMLAILGIGGFLLMRRRRPATAD